MVMLPHAPARKWYDSSRVAIYILGSVALTLKYLGIFDDMMVLGMIAFVGGIIIAQHADSLQHQVDQLIELERKRQGY
jgi:hypothetical protein